MTLGRTQAALTGLWIVAALAAPLAAVERRCLVRDFRFKLCFVVAGLDKARGPVEVWAPLPQSGPEQTISGLRVDAPWPLTRSVDTEYGDRYFYARAPAGRGPSDAAVFTVSFRVRRMAEDTKSGCLDTRRGALGRLLKADRNIPLGGPVAAEARAALAGKAGAATLQIARALYRHLLTEFRYDKSGTGWGHGDAVWICDSRRGDCSDLHSLFIGMARAESIPARYDIGFALPTGEASGPIFGHHCWVEFWDPGLGWVPVDVSDAIRIPARRAFYFGGLDADRVQWSSGRDIHLSPEPKQGPLNFFIGPVVEVGGKPWNAVKTTVSFTDLGGTRAALSRQTRPRPGN